MTAKTESIQFEFRGDDVVLAPGELFRSEFEQPYRDSPAATVREITQRIASGTPWRESVRTAYERANPWLFRIITDPLRHRFLMSNPFPAGSLVLDVGAGWGQYSLPLAASCSVCVLEPTGERLDFIRAVSQQEGLASRMYFVQSDYFATEFSTQFDYACCIGVLEWVGALKQGSSAHDLQLEFLRRLRGDIRDGGTLLLGIENRLGLKYLLGARDDHTGVANISTYDRDLAGRKWEAMGRRSLRIHTYTRAELTGMLKEAGFEHIEFHAAFPDYKLTQVLLPWGEAVDDYFLGGQFVPEHDGYDGSPLEIQQELQSHYRSLAHLRIASDFAPSFFVTAR